MYTVYKVKCSFTVSDSVKVHYDFSVRYRISNCQFLKISYQMTCRLWDNFLLFQILKRLKCSLRYSFSSFWYLHWYIGELLITTNSVRSLTTPGMSLNISASSRDWVFLRIPPHFHSAVSVRGWSSLEKSQLSTHSRCNLRQFLLFYVCVKL